MKNQSYLHTKTNALRHSACPEIDVKTKITRILKINLTQVNGNIQSEHTNTDSIVVDKYQTTDERDTYRTCSYR